MFDRTGGSGGGCAIRATSSLGLIAAAALAAASGPAFADDLFVAAPGAAVAAAPDGSEAAPWPDLRAAAASGRIRGGDVIHLGSGEWGAVTIGGIDAGGPVTIRPAEPGGVHMDSLRVRDSRNLTVEGLRIWPRGEPEDTLVIVADDATGIVLHDLDIRSTEDAAGYPGWTLSDWERHRTSGVQLRGDDGALTGSVLTGTNFGVAVLGDRGLVAGNRIIGFSGDGVRVVGDAGNVTGNVIQDCVVIDDNHADGVQSWSTGPVDGRSGRGVVRGLTVQNNIIQEWATGTPSPLRCDLQGIGMFDGMFEGVRIASNVVVVTAYHGIAVYGGLDVEIVNNTLVNPTGSSPEGAPWIQVAPHKDGRLSRDVVVANNLVPRINLIDLAPGRRVEVGNAVVVYPARAMAAPFAGDWTPLAESGLVDAAVAEWAPAEDIHGRGRQGAPDIGAIER